MKTPTNKRCQHCGQIKPLISKLWGQGDDPFGYSNLCRACEKKLGKVCQQCGVIKPLSHRFWPPGDLPDGFGAYCLDCSKYCARCDTWKPLKAFSRGNGGKGRHSYCIACNRAYSRENYKPHPTKDHICLPVRAWHWHPTPLYEAIPRVNGHCKPRATWTESECIQYRQALYNKQHPIKELVPDED
jgi:hypothetical protein